MNKYDFGEEIQSDSTMEWAYNKIKNNSRILEIGSNTGVLLKHLVIEKKCSVDIVEIDAEAALDSVKFVQNACIGTEEGDLQKTKWFEKLQNEKYDYVIILDVLEHIKNAKDVLVKIKKLLMDDGEILLSIPNIAHNSILISLLQNKFEYSSLGLLDETHIHFYTYSSLCKLLDAVELYAVRKEVKQIPVGENEIPVLFENIPYIIEHYLRNRKYGNAYQFLFTIKKDKYKGEIALEYSDDQPYELIIFDNMDVFFRKKVNCVDIVEDTIDLHDFHSNILRIDPLNYSCIIEDINIIAYKNDGSIKKIEAFEHSGIQVNEKIMFFDDDPHIFINLNDVYSGIKIQYKISDIGWGSRSHLENLKNYIDFINLKRNEENIVFNSKYQTKENEYNELDKKYNAKICEYDELDKKYNAKICEYDELDKKYNIKICDYTKKEDEYNELDKKYNIKSQDYIEKESECKEYISFLEAVIRELRESKIKRFLYRKKIQELQNILKVRK